MKQASFTLTKHICRSRCTARWPLALVAILGIAGTGPLAAATLAFQRVTGNATVDISSDLTLEVTDLGDGLAVFSINRGSEYESFLRTIYFEDPDDTLGTITFAPEFSTPGIVMQDPSNPGHPPGVSPFVTDTSFGADPPGPKKGIKEGETGSFLVAYNSTYPELESALGAGTVRVAVHAQGLMGGASDSYVTLPIPEPSTLVLLALAALGLTRRTRR